MRRTLARALRSLAQRLDPVELPESAPVIEAWPNAYVWYPAHPEIGAQLDRLVGRRESQRRAS